MIASIHSLSAQDVPSAYWHAFERLEGKLDDGIVARAKEGKLQVV